MDRWVVRGVLATLEKSRKRGTKRTSKRRPSRKHVENRTPKLRLHQRPLSCVGSRERSAPTYDDLYEKELVHYGQHPATSESHPCLPPTKRPCTWHPSRGLQHGNLAHRRQLLLGQWAQHTQKALKKVRRPGAGTSGREQLWCRCAANRQETGDVQAPGCCRSSSHASCEGLAVRA